MNIASVLAIPVITITFIGFAAGEVPGLKIDRATIALVGAVLLIAVGIIPPAAALKSIDLATIVLLFAMMVVSAYLREAGFFAWLGCSITKRFRSAHGLLAGILLTAGVLAAFFLNDTAVLVFTPLVLEVTRALKRNPLPYLIGLATAANIGSTASLTGNPQNMLIGQSSQIPYASFFLVLGPVALIGLGVVWLILVRLYRAEFNQPWPEECLPMKEKMDWPMARKGLVLTGLMLAAFLAGAPIPLAAMTAAAALLISRRVRPETIFAQVDWPLLVFFAGLFIVTGALSYTHLVDPLFARVEPVLQSGIGGLAILTGILSNLVSNVPAVLLIRPVVPQLSHPTQAWLTLAMASTLAGNLTLLGSVANLIMAEMAVRQGVKVSFREYLKAGVPITILTILIGIIWLSLVA